MVFKAVGNTLREFPGIARFCVAGLFLTVLFGAGTQPPPKQRSPIIDVHLHAYTNDPRFTNRTPNPVTNKPLSVTTEKAHMKATLDSMKRYNIVKGIVSNGTGPIEIVNRWRTTAPDRIIASPGFHGPPLPDLDSLRAQYLAGHFGAMGELGAQYEGLFLNDPILEPYFALAEEMDVPVGVHTGLGPPGTPYRGYPKFRAAFGNPLSLEEVLVRHPKLRLYIMHGGWPYLQETIAIMSLYPQVYADLAVINWIIPREAFHEHLKGLLRAGLGKRLMFGSDQMVWPEAIGMAIEGIESAKFLTEEQKRDIFFNNAARFLRLEEKK